MSRIARMVAVSGMLSIAGLAVPVVRADEPGGRDIPPAFAPLEYLLGKWNGQAMPKDSTQSFRGWPESHAWAWAFVKGKPVGMTVAITGGKVLAGGKLTFDSSRRVYRLEATATRPGGGPIAFEGALDASGKRLVLDQVDSGKAGAGSTLRLSVRPNSNFIRYTMSIERRDAGSVRFHPATEIGLTREGESLAGGSSSSERPKCIVTGGAATMTLTYQGRTFPICCSGCRDEFNDSPQKYIKKASLMAQSAGSKKAAQPAPSAVSRFEDAFAGDVVDTSAKKVPKRATRASAPREDKDDDPLAATRPSATASRAASLLRIGQNLEKSGKIRAALTDYKRIVKEFADTPSAKTARERIKAIEKP